jgi:hypothetical protein
MILRPLLRDTEGKVESMTEAGVLDSLPEAPHAWSRHRSLVFPQKFSNQTWHTLEHDSRARWDTVRADYGVPTALVI